uniref:Uncharacterized protein n=1 Tax=Arundo donax TaxID=35708 RepID=A0A0A9HHJ2_ARUDO
MSELPPKTLHSNKCRFSLKTCMTSRRKQINYIFHLSNHSAYVLRTTQ